MGGLVPVLHAVWAAGRETFARRATQQAQAVRVDLAAVRVSAAGARPSATGHGTGAGARAIHGAGTAATIDISFRRLLEVIRANLNQAYAVAA